MKLDIRMKSMDATRLNHQLYLWAEGKSGTNCKNKAFRLKQHLRKYGINDEDLLSNQTVRVLEERRLENFKTEWKEKVESEQGVRQNHKNKFRTYRLFKNEYCTEYSTEAHKQSLGAE